MRILPSLLKNRVIRKHKILTYQNRRIPDPRALTAKPSAAQLKKPKLSSMMAMTMVAMIVMAALLMVDPIVRRSGNDTLPHSTTIAAPTEAGMASFKPFGRHMIRTIAIIKAAIVRVITAGLNMGVSLPSIIDDKS